MEGIRTTAQKKEKKEVFTPDTHTFGFIERQKDFFERYAKGSALIVEGDENSFNFITKTITIDPKRYKDFDLSEEMSLHSTLHEIEHLLEDVALLNEEGGEKVFNAMIKKVEKSHAYGVLNNCLADIRENRAVIAKTNQGYFDLERKKIKEKLFVEHDYTNDVPKHLQFAYALFREHRTGEACVVSKEVRTALNTIYNRKNLMDVMTHPDTPMSLRLKLQDKYVVPLLNELREQDMKEQKEKEDKRESDDTEGDNDQKQEGGEDMEKDGAGNDKEEKRDGAQGASTAHSKGGKTLPHKNGGADPNMVFADDYTKAFSKFPDALKIEDLKRAISDWKEETQKNSPDKADAEYAEKIGVEKKDLQEYRRIADALQKIVNPETHVRVMEELKNLFSRIIAKRTKERLAPKYPLDEGDELALPAQLVSDVKSGNLQPKVWEDTEIKEKKGDRFGEVEVTLICDRSGSMNGGDGQKAVEQRNTAVLIMEVLKDFAKMCDDERTNVDKPLEVKSEIYSFASSEEDSVPLKVMGKDLGEAERILVLKRLFDLPGSTTDFNCLEALSDGLKQETKQKIISGELKKIVFVLTDGGSDSVPRVQKALKRLRDTGMVVIGIGLTEAGAPAVVTYAPDALVVQNVRDLPVVLGTLLKEHLRDI